MASDVQLLDEFVRSGCDQSFAELVTRYVDLVYSSAFRQLRQHELAEDATQRVWMILARKAPALPEGTVLGGWLVLATRNICMDMKKSEARRRARESKAAEMRPETKAPDRPDPQIAASIDDAVSSLGDVYRDAIVLRFFEGRSTSEVANRLGLNEAAVRQRLARAIRQLRRRLGVEGAGVSLAGLLRTLGPGKVQAPGSVISWLKGFSRVAGELRVRGPAKLAARLREAARARPADVTVAAAGLALVGGLVLFAVIWVCKNVTWDRISS